MEETGIDGEVLREICVFGKRNIIFKKLILLVHEQEATLREQVILIWR